MGLLAPRHDSAAELRLKISRNSHSNPLHSGAIRT